MSARAHFAKRLGQKLLERRPGFDGKLIDSQGSHQNPFNFVSSQRHARLNVRQVSFGQRKLQLAGDGQQEYTHLVGRFRRKERDVDVKPPLTLQINLQEVGATGREDPDNAAAVPCIGHLAGEHPVHAARKAAIPLATLTFSGRLIGFVHKHNHLAQRAQYGKDLFEVGLGRPYPAVAEILEDYGRDAQLSGPALYQKSLSRADAACDQIAHGQGVQHPLFEKLRVFPQPGLYRVMPRDIVQGIG